jgi:phage baseplate assembly protein W
MATAKTYMVSMRADGSVGFDQNIPENVKSFLQNVANILETRQGTVPLYREFGLPRRYEGKPINVARTIIVSEVTDAVRNFEPDATVKDITFEYDAETPCKLYPTVEVEINIGQEY